MGIWDDLKMQYRLGGFELKLIFWNVGAFLLSFVFYNFQFMQFNYPDWLALSSKDALFHPWTVLTYAFLHSGPLHLIFNMMILNFAGRLFLTFFSQRQFLGVYIWGAVFAGTAFACSYYFLGRVAILVGASGAIMAVLVAVTTYSPMMPLRLLLIGNVRLWHVTGVILLLDLMYILAENTGGHIAHLAGALFGFGFMKLLQSGTDLSKAVFFIFDLGGSKQKTPFKKVHKNPVRKAARNASAEKIVTKDKTQQQIDEILDKISRSGYDSLTQEEKDFLFRAGKE
jgi:membrane associated rhomboid family serine protease